MARKIFFSFHYERDNWRAGQVRNCDMIPNEDEFGFIDAVEWEKIEREGDDAIRRWIKSQMEGTSATVVLIGAETALRPWVRYELVESWNRGNAIVGLKIHGMKDVNSQTDTAGANPLDSLLLPDGKRLSAYCKTYDWVADDGRNNLGTWVEEAVIAGAKLGDVGKLTHSGSTSAAPRVIVSPPKQHG